MSHPLKDEPEKTQELLDAVVNGTPDLIYAKDLEGRYLLINREAAKWYGKPAEEILGLDDSDLFPDEIVQVLRENDHQVLVSAASSTLQERVVDRQGRPCVFLSTKGPLFDDSGRVSGIFSISRDITEQVQAQELLLANQEQLRALAIELSLAEEKERRRIAAELHDEIGQNLALAKLKLTDCREDFKLPAAATRMVRELELLLERTIQEVRTLTFQISPPLLYEVGLEAALDWLAEQFQAKHKLRVSFDSDLRSKPDEELGAALYHVARELLVNVVKHAQAKSVSITISQRGQRLELKVSDDGKGFPAQVEGDRAMSGFGLFNIRQRVQHLGGQLELASGPGGTEVTVRVPFAEADEYLIGSL
ncbi:PAS domain-containing sensor histidine kinase [Geomonas subterranea]|uniref:PAS domain-containing protein n=1 Tax=Geomonas subterranea TaxID=2847989 RepID=A0ABX8LTX0_9BACT|nr:MULTISPECIES: PAS domain-containing protein [Geomonas]QXE92940.1 PAS domain-containing protein [Geomonas subterranea]QXM08954.1 PAS domain-containing protein [Geomonas subterranea]